MPLALFVPPQVFLAHLQLSELYMVWLHTEIVDTVGPLELILNTPSHHRVHHSRNPEYIDKNYGGMLIIWDRLFGTFMAEDKSNPPVYGLVHPVRSFNPHKVQFHTWPVIWRRFKRATNWSNRFGVLFYGPGWKPGLPRLGNHDELPKIIRPVNSYDPQISKWKNAYIVAHFAFVLFFYHELTLHQGHFSSFTLNIGVTSLLISITTLGLMLDDKRRYNDIYELLRCLLFFKARHSLVPIIDHGIELTGLSFQHRMSIISIIYGFFAISTLINFVTLSYKISRDVVIKHGGSIREWASLYGFISEKKVD